MTLRPRGIRLQLTVLFIAGFGSLLTLGALAVYLTIAHQYRAQFDERLESSANTARHMFILERNRYLGAEAAVRHVLSELVITDRTFIALSRGGRRIASSSPIPGGPALSDLPASANTQPYTLNLSDRRTRIVRQPLEGDIDLYTGMSVAPLYRDLARLRLTFILGLPAILAIGGAVGAWGARWALRPVVAVADATSRVGAEVAKGETSFTRLPPRDAHDEVATLTDAFNELIDRLSEALRRERHLADRQRAFLAETAHELRTPVAIVRSTSEAALQTEHSSAEYRQVLESIAEEAAALGTLVHDLLLLARGAPAQAPGAARRIYLDDVVSHGLARIRALPEAKARHLSVGGLEAAPVLADPELMERALLALAHNALIHAPDSPVELSTGVHGTDTDRRSWMQVRDWGPGIQPDAQERIFERFARLDSPAPGAGLGLAIARWIAEANGGTIVVESEPGSGAAFRMTFPFQPEEAAAGSV